MNKGTKNENLVINNASGNFCETALHIPESDAASSYGKVYISSEILGNPECSSEILSIVINEIETTYYDELDKDSFESFEQSLHNINAALAKYAHNDSSWVGNINISIAILSGNTLHITTSGTAEVYLIRNKQIIEISEGLSTEEDVIQSKAFFNISSGELTDEDIILLSNNSTTQFINSEQLIGTCSNNKIEDIPNSLSQLTDVDNGEAMAFQIIKYSKEEVFEHEEEAYEEGANEDTEDNFQDISNTKEETSEIKIPKAKAKKIDFKGILKKIKKKGSSSNIDLSSPSWVLKLREKALKTKNISSQILREKRLQEGATNVKENISNKLGERTTSILIYTCVSILILIVTVNFIRRDSSTQAIETRSVYNEINGRIDDADLKSLYDKETAIGLLERQQERLAELKSSGFSSAKIQESLDEINTIRDKIFSTIRFKNPDKKGNIAEDHPSAKPKNLVFVDGKIIAYDKKNIYPISNTITDTKEIISPENSEENIIAATSVENDKMITFLTDKGNMIAAKDGEIQMISTSDESWITSAMDIAEYKGTSKIYILDPQSNEIWYHGISGNKASAKASRNSLKLDLSNAISLSVDGNIYVLKDDGTITKTYGKEDLQFSLSGMPEDLTKATSLFTSADHNRLYLLYPEQNSIVYTNKNGKYIGQYVLEEKSASTISDFYPDEEAKNLYIITSEFDHYKFKIY